MKQREVQDQNNTRWQCVQAFAGIETKVTEKAAQKGETAEGNVTVICTPSGGAQTVRLEVSANWMEEMSNDELLKSIQALTP